MWILKFRMSRWALREEKCKHFNYFFSSIPPTNRFCTCRRNSICQGALKKVINVASIFGFINRTAIYECLKFQSAYRFLICEKNWYVQVDFGKFLYFPLPDPFLRTLCYSCVYVRATAHAIFSLLNHFSTPKLTLVFSYGFISIE